MSDLLFPHGGLLSLSSINTWVRLGRPSSDRFGLTATADGRQWVWLDHPDRPVPQIGAPGARGPASTP